MSKTKRENFLTRLSAGYRVVFINDESLQEVATFRMSMRKLYVLFSTVFVVITVFTITVLLATPLRYYIPGYGDNTTHLQAIRLKKNVDSLSDLVAAQQLYEANMRKAINGDYNGKPDTALLDMNTTRQESVANIFPVQAIDKGKTVEKKKPRAHSYKRHGHRYRARRHRRYGR